ncbi:hypothetical protein COV17_03210 [Candidatus Woesearchaeota archaeon CG10_big_fil_rev_8_21_14_0_10_36_11]|nr:MAG: hypothetical protein COV17_03210 [Candidatus Woesearchaeota archaeon CG10_big_fil_rev_8_21_14_0_10_36_11]
MVIESLQSTLALFIVISASLASIAGIVVLVRFFNDKLKDLFSDSTYFIFFFLVLGYLLYSVGEVAYYLSTVVSESSSSMGIQDIYWSAGALFILISFIQFTGTTLRQSHDTKKLTIMAVAGVVLISFTLYLLFSMVSGLQSPFNYFYPIVSSLIVTFALSVLLFYSEIRGLASALMFFFLASSCILVADLLFSYSFTTTMYDTFGILRDVFYLLGYGLSFVGFIALSFRMRK